MATYLAAILPLKEGGYSVEFPDFPRAFSHGAHLEDCLEAGAEVLAFEVEEYVKARKELPEPSGLRDVEQWASNHKNGKDFDPERGHYIQLFRAPNMDMTPVRVSVSLPRSVLEDIDGKAKKAGLDRSKFLAAAARAYQP